MDKINDLAQLEVLTSLYYKKDILTNNFTMLDGFKKDITEGNLFFEERSSGLILFKNRITHWRIFYYLKNFSSDFTLPQDKSSAMEIVYRGKDTLYKAAVLFWEALGFRSYMVKKRMTASALKFEPDIVNSTSVRFAADHQELPILELITSAFDPYLGCIPSLQEVRQANKNNRILCMEDADGNINGVLHTEQRMNTCMINHLVIAPKARKRGYAKVLLASLSTTIPKSGNTKIQLWVNDKNIAAKHLYETAGFKYDGWESVGLLYRPGNIN